MHETAKLGHGETLQGKTLLITGANGGLGLKTAIGALRAGATVILACRTDAKAVQARGEAIEASGAAPEQAIAAGGFDMERPDAIREAVAALPAMKLDVVFLQAGGWVWADAPQVVNCGSVRVEQSVMKNVVGAHATLAGLLGAGLLAARARVVLIGGEGARGVPGGISKPSFETVSEFKRYIAGDWGERRYVPVDALGAAKFCAALWVRHVSQLAAGELEVVWFTPGLIGGTGGTAGMPAWKEFIFQRIAFPLLVLFGKAQWPDAAAAKCLDCLAGRIGHNGDLIGAPQGQALGPLTDQLPMNSLFVDPDFQAALFELCEAAAGPLPLGTASQLAHSAEPSAVQ